MAKGLSSDTLSQLFLDKLETMGFVSPFITHVSKELRLTRIKDGTRISVLTQLRKRYPKDKWYPDKVGDWNDAWALMHEIERRGIEL